jgi:hypothetical protein
MPRSLATEAASPLVHCIPATLDVLKTTDARPNTAQFSAIRVPIRSQSFKSFFQSQAFNELWAKVGDGMKG